MLTLRVAAAERAIPVRLARSTPLSRAEAILSVVVWLANRKFGVGASRRGLAFDAWQRSTYQPPVHRPFVGGLRDCFIFRDIHAGVIVINVRFRIVRHSGLVFAVG